MRRARGDSLRVALITGQLDWGGAERQLYFFATGLETRGLDVRVGCLSERVEPYGPRLQAAGIPVRAFPRRAAFDVARFVGLRRWLRAGEPSVVASFGEFAAAYAHVALFGTSGRPAHVAMLRRSALQLGGPRRWLVRRAFRRADVVTANSEAGRAYAVAAFGLLAEGVRILRNVVPDELLAVEADREGVRRELGLPEDEPIVGYVGRVARPKDIPTLCRTLARLEAREVRHTALVIGPDLDHPPDEWAGGGGRVLWLGVRRDVPRLVAASDVLVLTSRSEGTPNVVLEALALGVPVVSTRVGDIPRIVEAPGAGLAADVGDDEALAAAIGRLLADPASRRRMGAAGRAFVASEFGAERAVEEFLEILQNAVTTTR